MTSGSRHDLVFGWNEFLEAGREYETLTKNFLDPEHHLDVVEAEMVYSMEKDRVILIIILYEIFFDKTVIFMIMPDGIAILIPFLPSSHLYILKKKI